ncbi:MAG: hypothetical protein KFF49_09875, partial [Bacteroidales bacterium]|nr:hypothetical protein [Bacteroidales bacterium]
DNYMPDIIDAYLMAGDQNSALELIEEMKEHYGEKLDYYTSLPPYYMQNGETEIRMSFGFLQRVASSCRNKGLEDTAEEIETMVQEAMLVYYSKMQE